MPAHPVRFAAVIVAAALCLGLKARIGGPAETLGWSADSRFVVASSARHGTLRVDARGKAAEVPAEGLVNPILSDDGSVVIGARERSFVAVTVETGEVEEMPVSERQGKPVAYFRTRNGDVAVTKTVAHHAVQRSGGETGDPDPEPTKNFVRLWVDPKDPLFYVDTGYGLEVRHLWTGRALRSLDSGRKDQVYLDAVRDPEGHVVTAVQDEDGFRIWTPPDPPGSTWDLDLAAPKSLSGDGLSLAVGTVEGVAIYSTATQAPRELLKTKSPVVKVALSPDGGEVSAALEDGSIKIWTVDGSGLPSPVDRELTDTDVGRIRSDAITAGKLPVRQPTSVVALSGGTAHLRWTPVGRLAGWVGAAITDIDVKSSKEAAYRLPAIVRGRPYAWSADGSVFATVTATGVELVDVRKWKVVRTLETGGNHNQLEWRGDVLVVDAGSARAQAWDPVQAQPYGEPFTMSPDPTAKFVASPDGQFLAVRGRVPQVVHSRSGRTIAALDAQYGGVAAVAWSPDAKRLATAGNDGTLILWDASSWEPTALLEGAHGRELAFSPDGTKLLSASWEGAVVASVETGELLEQLPFDGLLSSVDWQAAGILMADNAGNVYVW